MNYNNNIVSDGHPSKVDGLDKTRLALALHSAAVRKIGQSVNWESVDRPIILELSNEIEASLAPWIPSNITSPGIIILMTTNIVSHYLLLLSSDFVNQL